MPPLRYRYQTIEFGETDIHVRTLRDRQQFADADGAAAALGIGDANWSLFGVIWAAGELLARFMYDYEIEGQRILEVGCGIGLSSLVLNHRLADITATDYHPEAEQFLKANTSLNQLRDIPFVRTNWNDPPTNLGQFDIIIGSDLLYERGHPAQLAAFVNQHANQACTVLVTDPGRGHHGRFSTCMMDLGYTYARTQPDYIAALTQPMRGAKRVHLLTYTR
ncbi:MAG: methyltransferase domain-containing protein [Rhodothermales bacterium]